MESFINLLLILLPFASLAITLALVAWGVWVTRSIKQLRGRQDNDI